MLRIDGYANGELIHRYLARCESVKLCPNDPENKKVLRHKRYYKIQWTNIKSDIKAWWERIGNPTGLPSPAIYSFGAIAIDTNFAANTYRGTDSVGATATIDFNSHDVSGTNRAMYAGGGWGAAGGLSMALDPTGSSQAFSNRIVQEDVLGADIWRLFAPATGVHTVRYTLNAASTKFAWEISFTGADQTMTGAASAKQFAASGATSSSLNITTTANNSYVLDSIVKGGPTSAMTEGQGTVANEWQSLALATRNGVHYIQKVTAGSQTMSWSWTGATGYDHLAVEVMEAAAATSTSTPPSNLLSLRVG